MMKKAAADKKKKNAATKKGSKTKKNSFLKNLHCIGMICQKGNKKQRNMIIDSLDKTQVRVIQDMIRDFLNSNYKINDQKILKTLGRNKLYMHKILDGNPSHDTVKNQLKQKGGFISSLLPLAAGIFAPALSGILGGR